MHHGIELRFGRVAITASTSRGSPAADDHALRAARGRQGPRHGARRGGRQDRLGGAGGRDRRVRDRSLHRPLPHRALHRRGPAAAQRRVRGAHLRRRGRLRRLTGALPARRSRSACADRVRARYPFAWFGILVEAPPSTGRAHLRAARPRLLARQHALPHAAAPVLPGASPTTRSTTGPTSGSGRSCTRAWRPTTAGPARRGRRSSTRASSGCASFVSSRCATAASTWPATPRTSCRRRARRA